MTELFYAIALQAAWQLIQENGYAWGLLGASKIKMPYWLNALRTLGLTSTPVETTDEST